jgi:hypothetical protein
VIAEFRNRNIFQTELNSNSATRPFVIGSVAMPGFGADAAWFFMAPFFPWESPLSRIGFDASFRAYVGGKVSGAPYKAYQYDVALNYRLSRKWAIGVGNGGVLQTADLTTGTVHENVNSYFVRLTLVPYLREGTR